GEAENDQVAHEVLKLDGYAGDREGDAGLPCGRHQDRGDHAGEQGQVDQAAQAHAAVGRRVLDLRLAVLAPVEIDVEKDEHREHDTADEERLAVEMLGRPEEIDAAQE